jgi:hypothetical protein
MRLACAVPCAGFSDKSPCKPSFSSPQDEKHSNVREPMPSRIHSASRAILGKTKAKIQSNNRTRNNNDNQIMEVVYIAACGNGKKGVMLFDKTDDY